MNQKNNKGKIDFPILGQRFPGPDQPVINMYGFNAIQFRGTIVNAIITIHFEAGQSIRKEIPSIGETNKVKDTFAFPLGDQKGKIEFSFQVVDPKKPSPCELQYELVHLAEDEYESIAKKTYKFQIPPDAPSKIAVLKAIASQSVVNIPANFSFLALAKASNLSREQLDQVLIELERERYITEFVLGGNDNFKVTLRQSGFDVSQ